MNSPGPNILLVDDDDLARKLVQRVLIRMRYEVHACPSAAQARDWAAAHADAIDLLITDINLQDESGGALAASLRAQLPALPVLYISGYPTPAEPLEQGSGFLGKPFTPDELSEAVRALLADAGRQG